MNEASTAYEQQSNKYFNREEREVFGELQQLKLDEVSLMDIVIKNYTERELSDYQLSRLIDELSISGRIKLGTKVVQGIYSVDWQKFILAYYQRLHAQNENK